MSHRRGRRGVSAGLERLDDPLLVRRRDAREERRVLRGRCELRVGHLLDLVAEEHRVGAQAHVLADLAGHEVVVARDDPDRDAALFRGEPLGPGREPRVHAGGIERGRLDDDRRHADRLLPMLARSEHPLRHHVLRDRR
jgi:hypothetical protein